MNKLRFLVVRRPGIYNTHSHVIQPMEHTLVNDGLPLLFKQFKANVRTWIKIYLPHCKSIDFEDISLEDANKYIETPEKLKTDYDGASILLNHPQQYKFTSFNMEQLYVAISDNSWHLTPNTLDFFGGTDYISTCLNYTNTNNNNCNVDWIECNNEKLIEQFDVTNRNTFKKYSQYISFLHNKRLNSDLILFHSNHLSLPLSRQIGKIIKNWQCDKLLLETDAVRIDRYVNTMKKKQTFLFNKLLLNLDIGVAINAANKNIATHIILSDWNIAQYRIMSRIARYMDTMQSKDAIDTSTGITLHVIGQLFCPSLLPEIQKNILNEYYDNTLMINKPHWHWIYEKRNDIFANTINNCNGNKLLGVFGHSHIHAIRKRLIGEKKLNNPFQTLGSHNIQF
eukprot:208788_1